MTNPNMLPPDHEPDDNSPKDVPEQSDDSSELPDPSSLKAASDKGLPKDTPDHATPESTRRAAPSRTLYFGDDDEEDLPQDVGKPLPTTDLYPPTVTPGAQATQMDAETSVVSDSEVLPPGSVPVLEPATPDDDPPPRDMRARSSRVLQFGAAAVEEFEKEFDPNETKPERRETPPSIPAPLSSYDPPAASESAAKDTNESLAASVSNTADTEPSEPQPTSPARTTRNLQDQFANRCDIVWLLGSRAAQAMGEPRNVFFAQTVTFTDKKPETLYDLFRGGKDSPVEGLMTQLEILMSHVRHQQAHTVKRDFISEVLNLLSLISVILNDPDARAQYDEEIESHSVLDIDEAQVDSLILSDDNIEVFPQVQADAGLGDEREEERLSECMWRDTEFEILAGHAQFKAMQVEYIQCARRVWIAAYSAAINYPAIHDIDSFFGAVLGCKSILPPTPYQLINADPHGDAAHQQQCLDVFAQRIKNYYQSRGGQDEFLRFAVQLHEIAGRILLDSQSKQIYDLGYHAFVDAFRREGNSLPAATPAHSSFAVAHTPSDELVRDLLPQPTADQHRTLPAGEAHMEQWTQAEPIVHDETPTSAPVDAARRGQALKRQARERRQQFVIQAAGVILFGVLGLWLAWVVMKIGFGRDVIDEWSAKSSTVTTTTQSGSGAEPIHPTPPTPQPTPPETPTFAQLKVRDTLTGSPISSRSSTLTDADKQKIGDNDYVTLRAPQGITMDATGIPRLCFALLRAEGSEGKVTITPLEDGNQRGAVVIEKGMVGCTLPWKIDASSKTITISVASDQPPGSVTIYCVITR